MRSRAFAFVALTLVVGCATTLSRSERRDLAAELGAVGFDVPEEALDVVTFVEASSGRAVDQRGLAELLGEYAIVFVGERHDVAAHHLAQRDVVVAVRSVAAGFPVVIGAEMFARDKQDLISRWESNELDTRTFIEDVGWEEGWGMPWDLYAPVLELALYEDIALVGLNAPAGISRAVYRGGIGSLDEEQAGWLPLPFGPVPDAYREYLVGALVGHMPRPEGSGDDVAQWEATVENFVMAQRVWDESMAAWLFEAYQGFGAEARHVVLAGGGHVRNGWGIESALRRYTDIPVYRIMCVALDGSPEASAELSDLVTTGAADLYCITR